MRSIHLIFACLLLVVSSFSFAGSHKMAPKSMSSGKFQVAFINEMVGGKKTWVMVPSDAHFKKGAMVSAKVVNTLNEPHGFEVPGHVKPMVIKGNSSQSVSFKAKKSGDVAVKCHMHPAHVGTKFTVK